MQDLILSPIPVSELVKLIASEVESRLHWKEPTEPLQDRIGLEEAIEITGLKKATIYKLTMEGTIPHEKFRNGRLVFSRKELTTWTEQQTVRKQTPEEIAIAHLAKEARKKIK